MDADTRIGTEFAGYRIESVLGRGGMGVVYLATDTRLGRQVALKLLSPELSNDQRFRDRFIQESRMAAGLEHHGIVPVHEAGERDGQLYIAMRHIAGDDLASVIERDGPLSVDRTVSIIDQVADALDAAHERGLVHRDVKPANILVETSRRDRAYLTDFGVTKRTTSRSGLTQTGQFMGTVDYVAPEQIEGQEVDGRADQYSLGCVAFECLTGQAPFAKDSEVATIYAHLQEERPRPSAIRPDLPKAADNALAKAMAKRPEDRYETCGAMAEALRQAATVPAGSPARTGRSRLALAVALAGVLVVAAVAVAALATRHPEGSGPSTSPSAGAVTGTVPALARIDPKTNRIVRSFNIRAGALAVGDGAVWGLGSAEAFKINPQSNAIVAHVPIPGLIGGFVFGSTPYSIAVGEGGVWVAAPPAFIKIDPRRNAIAARVTARSVGGSGSPTGPLDPSGVRAGFGAVWVLNTSGGVVTKIDPVTARRLDSVEISNPAAIAVGEGAVWVTNDISDVVFRIDPTTARIVKEIPLAGGANGVAVGEGSVWVSSSSNGAVFRIDPATNQAVETIPVARGIRALAVGGGSVWVANALNGSLARIDAATNRLVQIVPLGTCRGGGLSGIAVLDDSVWVSSKCF